MRIGKGKQVGEAERGEEGLRAGSWILLGERGVAQAQFFRNEGVGIRNRHYFLIIYHFIIIRHHQCYTIIVTNNNINIIAIMTIIVIIIITITIIFLSVI